MSDSLIRIKELRARPKIGAAAATKTKELVRKLLETSDLDINAKMLLVVLANHVSKGSPQLDGMPACWPSEKIITKCASFSERTMRRARAECEARKLLQVYKHATQDGPGNVYVFCLPQMTEAVREAGSREDRTGQRGQQNRPERPTEPAREANRTGHSGHLKGNRKGNRKGKEKGNSISSSARRSSFGRSYSDLSPTQEERASTPVPSGLSASDLRHCSPDRHAEARRRYQSNLCAGCSPEEARDDVFNWIECRWGDPLPPPRKSDPDDWAEADW